MFPLPLPLSAPNSPPMQGQQPTRDKESATPTPQSGGAWGPGAGDTVPGAHCSPRRGRPSPGQGSSTGSSLDPHGEPAGLEKGRPEERQTPLLVLLHLLHVAHNAPAKTPGGEEPNVPHRDRGFAPTPLRWILVFQRCANKIQSRCKLFAPSFQTLLQSKFRAIGGRKKGEENPEPSPQPMNTPGFGAGGDPPSRNARGVFPFSQ